VVRLAESSACDGGKAVTRSRSDLISAVDPRGHFYYFLTIQTIPLFTRINIIVLLLQSCLLLLPITGGNVVSVAFVLD